MEEAFQAETMIINLEIWVTSITIMHYTHKKTMFSMTDIANNSIKNNLLMKTYNNKKIMAICKQTSKSQ